MAYVISSDAIEWGVLQSVRSIHCALVFCAESGHRRDHWTCKTEYVPKYAAYQLLALGNSLNNSEPQLFLLGYSY